MCCRRGCPAPARLAAIAQRGSTRCLTTASSATTVPGQNASRFSLLPTLRDRGLLADVAGDATALSEAANRGPLRVYCGLDPTAASLHVGNLLCLMVMGWCRRLGHQPVCVLGGATGRIGDPSGVLGEGQDVHVDLRRLG